MIFVFLIFILAFSASAAPFQNGPQWLMFREGRHEWSLLMPYQSEDLISSNYTFLNPVLRKAAVIDIDAETDFILRPEWDSWILRDIPDSLSNFPENPGGFFQLEDMVVFTGFWQPFPVYELNNQGDKAIVFKNSRFMREWQNNLRDIKAFARLGQLCISVNFSKLPDSLDTVLLTFNDNSGTVLDILGSDLKQKNGLLYSTEKKSSGWFSKESQKLFFFIPLSFEAMHGLGDSIHITLISQKDNYRESYGIGTLYLSDIAGFK